MTVSTQLTIDGDPAALDRVLTMFSGARLSLVYGADSSFAGTEIVELHAGEVKDLSRFYRACREAGITLDVRRISHH